MVTSGINVLGVNPPPNYCIAKKTKDDFADCSSHNPEWTTKLEERTVAIAREAAEASIFENELKQMGPQFQCWNFPLFFIRLALNEIVDSRKKNCGRLVEGQEDIDGYEKFKKYLDRADPKGPISESYKGYTTKWGDGTWLWGTLPNFEDYAQNTIQIEDAETLRRLGPGYMVAFVYDDSEGKKMASHAMLSIGNGELVGHKNQCIFQDWEISSPPYPDMWIKINLFEHFQYVNGKKAKHKYTLYATRITHLLQMMIDRVEER